MNWDVQREVDVRNLLWDRVSTRLYPVGVAMGTQADQHIISFGCLRGPGVYRIGVNIDPTTSAVVRRRTIPDARLDGVEAQSSDFIAMGVLLSFASVYSPRSFSTPGRRSDLLDWLDAVIGVEFHSSVPEAVRWVRL